METNASVSVDDEVMSGEAERAESRESFFSLNLDGGVMVGEGENKQPRLVFLWCECKRERCRG